MLKLDAIHTSYGQSQILFGVSLDIEAGQVVTLMGRNGMGKTTTVHSIMGMTPPHGGDIQFEGRSIRGLAPYQVARLGIGLVPEGRRIFPNLTVAENLTATAANRGDMAEPWTLKRIYAMFPALAERHDAMGSQLSGGEQQMLAIGRALMTNPSLMILDEATEGLAPLVRAKIWQCLDELKAQGQMILVIDKDAAALERIADRHYILAKGQVVWSGTSAELAADSEIKRRHLGV